jgi:Flp pilus assembly protein CpaB
MSRVILILAIAVGVVAAVIARGHGGTPAPVPSLAVGPPILVLARDVVAGATIDPGNLRVRHAAGPAPAGAISRVDLAAFRVAVVAIPRNLPLVPSLLRLPGRGAGLRSTERAVGVRVDEVSGLPGLLAAGSIVDVVIGGAGAAVERIDGATVLVRPTRIGGGSDWAVALRVGVRDARRLSLAEAAGRDVRLLARGAG